MPNVVFVCTANICRSPVAQVLFADWLRRNAIPGEWQVLSAGTWAKPGLPASPYSREVVAELGLDLGAHRSRPIDADLMEQADLLVCMTRSHCEALQIELPQHAERVHLLAALAGTAYDVPDPYGGPRRGYEAMRRELQGLIEASGPRIVELASRLPAPGDGP